MPYTEMIIRFLPPVLSAQFMVAATLVGKTRS
jgi:hypothetical protein